MFSYPPLCKPVISTLDRLSNKMLPSAYTETESAYLQAYSAAGVDGIITEAERRILIATAGALNITTEKVSELERMFDSEEE